jgi:hypothetical protein
MDRIKKESEPILVLGLILAFWAGAQLIFATTPIIYHSPPDLVPLAHQIEQLIAKAIQINEQITVELPSIVNIGVLASLLIYFLHYLKPLLTKRELD